MKTSLFDFDLPQERIAMRPVEPRDASRLLVVRRNTFEDHMVRELPDLLMPGDLVIFNNTKVIPARLLGKRGEANIEVTLLKNTGGRNWRAFARPGKKLKVGSIIDFSDEFSVEVKQKHENGEVDLEWNTENWQGCLTRYGKMPLPPYIKRDAESGDRQSYQTTYAQKDGAVAAPTAGLHFTKELLEKLDKRGIEQSYITLHVGAGTFLPVKSEDTEAHVMHTEFLEISEHVAGIINKARKDKRRIVAVGTTSLRALESAADETGHVRPMSGETGIFITPGYRFKVVDILMTNFHLPRSTLFMLVSAFAGLDHMKEAYQHAIRADYRFYSYGDACLLFR